MKIIKNILAVVLACFSGALLAQTTTVQLGATQDASIYALSSSTNFGTSTTLESYPWGANYSRRFLLQFDLSSIPTNATIVSAKVKLNVSHSRGFQSTVNAHLITSNWDEQNVTWSSFSGQFNGVVSASETLEPFVSNGEWDVSTDVQAFVDGGLVNHGWIFMDSNEGSSSQNYWYFYSKESTTNQPVLEVVYEEEITETALTITPSITNVTCFGGDNGAITLNVSGGTGQGYSYSWNPSLNVETPSNSASDLSAGTWEITVIDQGNPSTSETITVEVTEPSDLGFSKVLENLSCGNCNDGSITFTGIGGTPPYMYSIDGGVTYQSGPQFNNLSLTTYTLAIKDANNCVFIDEEPIELDVNELITNPFVIPSKCDEGTGVINLNINGGYPPYVVNWSDGEMGASRLDLLPAKYGYKVTDNAGNEIDGIIAVNSNILWSSLQNINFDAENGTLTSTTTGDFSSFAYSEATIKVGENGYVEFDVPNNNNSFMVGLSGRSYENDPGHHEYVIAKYPPDPALSPLPRLAIRNSFGAILPPGEKFYTNNFDKLRVEKYLNQVIFYLNGEKLIDSPVYLDDEDEELRVVFKIGYGGTSFKAPSSSLCDYSNSIDTYDYYKLERELSSSIISLTSNTLRFEFNEDYSVSHGSKLKFKIYDNLHRLKYSTNDEDITIKKGLNKITIEALHSKLGNNQTYILEVENSKGEKSYLRFRI